MNSIYSILSILLSDFIAGHLLEIVEIDVINAAICRFSLVQLYHTFVLA